MIRFLICLLLVCQLIPAMADMNAANKALQSGEYEKAAQEFRKLADQGNAKAQSHLGYLYYVGEGVPQSYEDAVNWYRKAAVQGDRDAQYNLAVAYAFGEGATLDLKEAAIWYRRAADQGHSIAQYSLGISYTYGEGVPQDEKLAGEWFIKSAESGYERAQVMIGSKYHTGEGVPQDYKKAAAWYRKAADRGNASAQYNLGTLYRAGKGVSQDYDQAVRWFRMAADQGYVAAQNELSSMERTIAGSSRQEKITTAPETSESTSTAKKETTEQPAPAASPDKSTETSKKKDVATVTPTEQPETKAVKSEEVQTAATTASEEEDKPGFLSKLFKAEDKQTITESTTTTDVPGKPLTAEPKGRPAGSSDISIANVMRSRTQPLPEKPAPATNIATKKAEQKEINTPYIPQPNTAPEVPVTPPVTVEKTAPPPTPTITDETKDKSSEESIFSKLFSSDKQPSAVTEQDKVTPEISETKVEKKTTGTEVVVKNIETPYIPKPNTTVRTGAPDYKPESVSEDTTGDSAAEKPEDESEGMLGFLGRIFSTDQQATGIKSDTKPDTEIALAETREIKTTTAPKPRRQHQEEITENPEVRVYAEGSSPAAKTLATIDEKNPDPVIETTKISEIPEPVIDTSAKESDTIAATKSEESAGIGGFFKKIFGSDQESPQDTELAEPVENKITSETDTTQNTQPEVVLDESNFPAEDETLIIARVEPDQIDTTIGETAEEALEISATDSVDSLTSLAVEGDVESQYQLGKLHYQGIGVEKNLERAFTWFRRAAIQGNAEAQYSLGNMYLMGEGISQSDWEARTWYQKAASQGHLSAQSNFENLDKKFPQKEEKTRSGDSQAVTSTEDGNQPDVETSTTQPVVEDPAVSSYERGMAYAYGEGGLPQDYITAFKLFEHSAQQGYAPAQFKTGQAYVNGEGVEQDYHKALEWYQKAATQGHTVAQRSLGSMYLNGQGVDKNKALAYAWFSILADKGNLLDVHRRDALGKELTESEKAEADRLKQQLNASLSTASNTL